MPEMPQAAPTRRWVMVLTALGSLMAALDTLVVASAIPTIRADLGASLPQLEWTVNAYNLSLAVLLVPAAVLGDRLGRARSYAAGLTLFALSSVGLRAGADRRGAHRRARGAGRGGALILTLGLALLTSAYPAERRGEAVGLLSAVTGISVACGPLVGGLVVDGLDWQWVFWVNVPIGLLATRSCSPRAGEPGAAHDVRPAAACSCSRRLLRPGLGAGAQRVGRLVGGGDRAALVAGGALLVAFAAGRHARRRRSCRVRCCAVRGFAAGNSRSR